MRIAIVDDISEERTLLHNRLESQFSRRNVHTDIFEYENGETFLTSAKECPFTVAFLDIYMNGSNGIDTAKELRRSDTDCLLIFTTTSSRSSHWHLSQNYWAQFPYDECTKKHPAF